MGISQNAIAMGLVWLAGVSGTLACESRAPLTNGASTGPSVTSKGMPMSGADAGVAVQMGVDAGSGGAPNVPPPQLVNEVMRRWNLAADSVPSPIDFHWLEVDEFPHPTFKGGTAAAYGQFASVLLTFFQRDDDFAFLAQNHLFTMELRDDTSSGQGGVVTSFEKLADDFSSSTAFGDITPADHDGLVQIAQRIHQM